MRGVAILIPGFVNITFLNSEIDTEGRYIIVEIRYNDKT